MNRKSKRIVLINGIYAPDRGATAQVTNDLVGKLINDGLEVIVVCTDRSYKSAKATEVVNGEVHRVKSYGLGNGKFIRLASAMTESFYLLRKSIRFKADFYIICTDPPLLHLFSSFMLKEKKWALWTMDIYPEAFVANGLIGKDNIFYKWYKNTLTKCPPSALIYLGLRQKDFIESQYDFRGIPSFVLPCGTKSVDGCPNDKPLWKKAENKIYFAYCGNLGEAHSPELLKEMISQSDPDQHEFILSIFGTNTKTIVEFAQQRNNVKILGWISAEEMTHLDIQIVNLKKEWTHICVPSKAVSSICYEVPFVFHGELSGDICDQYSEALWHIDNNKDMAQEIKSFFAKLNSTELIAKKQKTKAIKNKLLEREKFSYVQISNHLKNE